MKKNITIALLLLLVIFLAFNRKQVVVEDPESGRISAEIYAESLRKMHDEFPKFYLIEKTDRGYELINPDPYILDKLYYDPND